MTAPKDHSKRYEPPKIPSGAHEVLWQLFRNGPTWDGNIVCKVSRVWLWENGFSDRAAGFNFLTAPGVEMAVSLGMDRRKEKERRT